MSSGIMSAGSDPPLRSSILAAWGLLVEAPSSPVTQSADLARTVLLAPEFTLARRLLVNHAAAVILMHEQPDKGLVQSRLAVSNHKTYTQIGYLVYHRIVEYRPKGAKSNPKGVLYLPQPSLCAAASDSATFPELAQFIEQEAHYLRYV